MELTGPCVVCKNITIRKCAGCEGRFICDKEHQKVDWTRGHKYTCSKLWRLVEDPNFGHLFRARKDLKEGTVLLKRKPLLVFPREIIQEEFEDLPQQKPIWTKYGAYEKKRTCLGCNRLLIPNSTLPIIDYNQCKKCSWPVCNSFCENELHKAECQVFTSNKVNYGEFESWSPEDLYMAVGNLRLLLLKTSKPQKYAQFLDLEIWSKKPLSYEKAVTDIKKFVFQNCKIPSIPDEEFEIGFKILSSNRLPCNHRMSFDTRFSYIVYEAEKGGKGMILMNSCIPIGRAFIDPSSYEVTIITTQDIGRNHMLSISYDNSWLTTKDLKPFFNRQLKNVLLGYRICGCKLCQFKDDCAFFDTPEVRYLKFSGIKCGANDCPGILTIRLGEDNLNAMPNAWEWSCSLCDKIITLEVYYNTVKLLRMRFLYVKDSGDMESFLTHLTLIRETVDETNGLMHLALYITLNHLCKLIHEDKSDLEKYFGLFDQYFRIVDPLFKCHFRSAYFKIFYSLVNIRSIGLKLAREQMNFTQANEIIGEFVYHLYKNWEIVQFDPMSQTAFGEKNDLDFMSGAIAKYIDGFKATIKKRIHEIDIVLPDVNHLEGLFVFRDTFNLKHPPLDI